MEVRPSGIHIVLIEPGDFKTDITKNRQKAVESTIDSVYRDTFKKVVDAVESGERKGPNPQPIAELIHSVISKKSPRLRYSVGKTSQRIAVPLKKFLPSRLFELFNANTFQKNS